MSLSFCHVIGWWDIYVNEQLNRHGNKVANECRCAFAVLHSNCCQLHSLHVFSVVSIHSLTRPFALSQFQHLYCVKFHINPLHFIFVSQHFLLYSTSSSERQWQATWHLLGFLGICAVTLDSSSVDSRGTRFWRVWDSNQIPVGMTPSFNFHTLSLSYQIISVN